MLSERTHSNKFSAAAAMPRRQFSSIPHRIRPARPGIAPARETARVNDKFLSVATLLFLSAIYFTFTIFCVIFEENFVLLQHIILVFNNVGAPVARAVLNFNYNAREKMR